MGEESDRYSLGVNGFAVKRRSSRVDWNPRWHEFTNAAYLFASMTKDHPDLYCELLEILHWCNPKFSKGNIKETFRTSAMYCLVCLLVFATSASFYTQLKTWVIELESRLKYLTNITCGSFCSLLKELNSLFAWLWRFFHLSRVSCNDLAVTPTAFTASEISFQICWWICFEECPYFLQIIPLK